MTGSWFPKFFQWTGATPEAAAEAERRVFDGAEVPCTYQDTPVGPTKQHTVHSVSAGNRGPHVVCLPGYAAGAGFFYKNLKGLSQHTQMHVVDWLGTGLSGRPAFTCNTREETEAWFVESLERWRKEKEIQSMVLVGHSLGGYLSSNYALRYPDRVDHLVLVCPAGMGEKPADYEPPEIVRNPWSRAGLMYRFAASMWNLGVTPGVVVRSLGPFGRRFTRGYAERRLSQSMGLPQQECDNLEQYIFQILGNRGSGEFALRHILYPFAWPHAPMQHRVSDLKTPITFIYGSKDWMDPAGGTAITKDLAARRRGADGGLPKAGNPHDCKVLFIEDAGHFAFLEKPQEFNAMFLETIQHCLDVEVDVKEHRATFHGVTVDESNEGVTPEVIAKVFTDV